MDIQEIKKMSRIERVQAMEALWDSLIDEDSEMESPEWHQEILEERKRKIEAGEAEFLSFNRSPEKAQALQAEDPFGENNPGNTGGQQETGKAVYCFMDAVAGEAEQYAAGHTTPMSPVLEEMERYTLEESGYPGMLTGRVEGRFLQLIVSLTGFRDVVDIGTFTGYSALAMAESVPPDGRVLTIEHNPAKAEIAQGFFDRSPHGGKIDLHQGEAVDILKSLPSEATDLVFIDADKTNYLVYYHESMRILRKGGLILADNALWYGRIFDPEDEDSKAVACFNEEVNGDDRAEKLFLTLRDGIYLIRKKRT